MWSDTSESSRLEQDGLRSVGWHVMIFRVILLVLFALCCSLILLFLSGINVCAGKPATASNVQPNLWGNPQTPLTENKNTATSPFNSFYTGTTDIGNWWQVDLGHPGFQITEIRFRTRNDCCGDHGSFLRIIMLDSVCVCMSCVSFAQMNLTSSDRMESKMTA